MKATRALQPTASRRRGRGCCPDGGPVNPKGARLLRAARRRAARGRHHAVAHALPLGPAAGAARTRRLAGPRHGGALRRLRRWPCTTRSATGCATWTTLNEPWCSAFLGYTARRARPGPTATRRRRSPAAHHLHARPRPGGAGAARAATPRSTLGITLNLTVADPVDPTDPRDVDAARRIDGAVQPVLPRPDLPRRVPGRPPRGRPRHLGLERHILDGDLEVIATPIDVLGVNYYNGERDRPRAAAPPLADSANDGRATRSPFPAADGAHRHPRGLPRTAMDWEVQPDGLTRLLVRLHDEYAGTRRTSPVRHRERRRVRRRGRRGRLRRRPRTGSATCARTSARSSTRVDAGRGRPRLLLLVAARQLRVGVGLRQALRYRPSRLRHARCAPPKASALDYARIIATRQLPTR